MMKMMKKMVAGAALVATLVGSASPALANTESTTTQTPAVQTTTTGTANTTTSTTTETPATTTAAEATTEATTETTTETTVELPSAGLTPDKLFYFLKVWVEQVQLTLTRDAANRATLLETQAQTRLAEAVEMAEAGKTDLAQKALTEAQAKLAEASKAIEVAKESGKDLEGLVQRIEEDQTRFALAVSAMLTKLPEEVQEELEPLTADLLVQVAAAQDAANEDPDQTEEAEKAAEEAGLTDELSGLQPRMILVLKAMAEASGKDLVEIHAMYQKNPGLGRIAKELGLKMGAVQHAAQIEWKKAKAGEVKVEVEVEVEAGDEEAEAGDEEAEVKVEAESTTETNSTTTERRSKQVEKESRKGEKKGDEHPVAKGLEKAKNALENAKGRGQEKKDKK